MPSSTLWSCFSVCFSNSLAAEETPASFSPYRDVEDDDDDDDEERWSSSKNESTTKERARMKTTNSAMPIAS
jgi:hypothetical protein